MTAAPPPRDDPAEPLREEVARLRTQVNELIAAVAMRDALIATAGRELRNPMAAVAVAVRHLVEKCGSDSSLPSWLPTRVEKLDRHVRHVVRRATTLLDVARLAAGQSALDRQIVDLGAAVSRVIGELGDEAAWARCPLDVDLPAGFEGLWDREAVEQITYNLVSNALKFGAGHRVTVSVDVDAERAFVRVGDQGPGIALQDLERIFELPTASEHRAAQPGLGVGLWVARQLARAQGGDVTVESTVGVESSFTLSLPRGIHDR